MTMPAERNTRREVGPDARGGDVIGLRKIESQDSSWLAISCRRTSQIQHHRKLGYLIFPLRNVGGVVDASEGGGDQYERSATPRRVQNCRSYWAVNE